MLALFYGFRTHILLGYWRNASNFYYNTRSSILIIFWMCDPNKFWPAVLCDNRIVCSRMIISRNKLENCRMMDMTKSKSRHISNRPKLDVPKWTRNEMDSFILIAHIQWKRAHTRGNHNVVGNWFNQQSASLFKQFNYSFNKQKEWEKPTENSASIDFGESKFYRFSIFGMERISWQKDFNSFFYSFAYLWAFPWFLFSFILNLWRKLWKLNEIIE